MWWNKCKHVWKCVHTRHYNDISYVKNGSPSTFATFSCIYCGEIKEQVLYGQGHITTDELNSAVNWNKYEKEGKENL